MPMLDDVVDHIQRHGCCSHPVFEHWSEVAPSTEVIGALFHHIRSFCDSTRPGWNLPSALQDLGLSTGSDLLRKIVASEEDHGPQLATMAGHIMNRSARSTICPNLYNQAAVEARLKSFSDLIFGSHSGYDPATGLMPETKNAIAVLERRKSTDKRAVLRNLGTTLALEIISNRHLIPGEKGCLVDSGLYRATLDEPEMFYLREHYGEVGAEAMHERYAIEAIGSVMDNSNESLIKAGADDFLDSLATLWDLLDGALLQQSHVRPRASTRG